MGYFSARYFGARYWKARYWQALAGAVTRPTIAPPPRRIPRALEPPTRDYFDRLNDSVYTMWANLTDSSVKITPPPRHHPHIQGHESSQFVRRLTNSAHDIWKAITEGRSPGAAPPRLVPQELMNDPESRDYFTRMANTLYQIWFSLQ